MNQAHDAKDARPGTRTGPHVVLGARGGTGAAVVRELAGRGLPARAVSRGGASDAPGGPAVTAGGVEQIAADITDREQLRCAVAGAAVVYHCAQPAYTRWPQEFPAMTRAVIAAAIEAGVKLVFADNLYMYEPGQSPLREDTPATAATKKGEVRRAMADELLAAHRDGALRMAIGRSSDYYGPGGPNSAVGERFFRAVLAGKKAQWFAELDEPHTLSYLPDMARALVTLGTHDEADGKVWHLPAAEPLTGRRFVELAAEVAGTQARPAVLGLGMIRLAGVFVPVLREFPELLYQWQRPFVSDASRYEAAFGPFAATPHEQALAETLAWYRRRAAV